MSHINITPPPESAPIAPVDHNFHPVYRPDIDGLRALAILPVVAYHAFPSWVPGGFVGVDIFFVISGYLIANIIFKSLAQNDFSFVEFYAHRIRRIFPALILVMSAVHTIGWFALLPDEYKMLGKHMVGGAGFIQNFLLWQESGYFDVASELKPLLHLWSLSVEEQFYVFFPIIVWALWRWGINALTLIVLVMFISFHLSKIGVRTDAVKTFFLPHTRIWELMVGVVLAYMQVFRHEVRVLSPTFRKSYRWLVDNLFFNRTLFFRTPPSMIQRKVMLANFLAFVGLALIINALFTLDKTMPFPGSRALAPVFGAMFLIWSGSIKLGEHRLIQGAWINRKLLAFRPMVWVGLISYPLYLWHWPLLSLARIVESETPGRWWRVGIVVLSFLLAGLTYWLIEKPIRYGGRRKLKNIALVVLMVMVGFIGYNNYSRDGLDFRVKKFVQLNEMFDLKFLNPDGEAEESRCKKLFPSIIKFSYCRTLNDQQPSVQVIGDSHANMIYWGLKQTITYPNNVFFFAGSGALPFVGVISHNTGEQESYRDSVYVMGESVNQALANDNIKTIILASRGPLYLSKRGFPEAGFATEERNWQLKLLSRTEITDHYEIWRVAMRETLDRLLAKNKKIIFVLDNPELGFDPKSCVDSRPLRLTNNKVRTPCAVPRKDFDERNKSYRDLVAEVLKSYPQVKVFDAAAPLCDEKYCWAMKDGKILYYDGDHLSLYGSKYIAQFLAPLI